MVNSESSLNQAVLYLSLPIEKAHNAGSKLSELNELIVIPVNLLS